MSDRNTKTVGELNDAFRTTFSGGSVVMTSGVSALPPETKAAVLDKVKAFDAFSPDNDPYGEHDFGSFEHTEQKFFWKIDYYNKAMDAGSEDPSDPAQTTRVLTIMLAEEY
ncbi:MAG: DUF3768 domain-containing protein [Alphaproteobacteria bacterium]|nr:DUF3768 domain-containing protein [Alphaproteobacteria bacterium]